MASYPWSVLGLEGISGEPEIRKAYARLLKTARPDTDPAGFQKLVEARDRALAILEARARPGFPALMMPPGARPQPATHAKRLVFPNRSVPPVPPSITETEDPKPEPDTSPPPVEIPLQGRDLESEAIKLRPPAVEIGLQGAGGRAGEEKKPQPPVEIALQLQAKRQAPQRPAGADEQSAAISPALILPRLQELLTSPQLAKGNGAVEQLLAALEELPRQHRLGIEAQVIRTVDQALKLEQSPVPALRGRRERNVRSDLILGLEEVYGWLSSDRRVHESLPPGEAGRFISSVLALRKAAGRLLPPHHIRLQNAAAAEEAKAAKAKRVTSAIAVLLGLLAFAISTLARHTQHPLPPYPQANDPFFTICTDPVLCGTARSR